MPLRLRISPSLIHNKGEKLEYLLDGNTIGECINTIPELNSKLWLDGRLNPQILLFHNNMRIGVNDLTNVIEDNDILDVIPAIEGG